MKRFFAAALCLVMLLCAHALSEDAFACRCGEDACVCFLMEEDIGPAAQGVIQLLKERGYLDPMHSRGVFDAAVTQAVKDFQRESDFDETGTLDNDTLTMLIFGEMPGAGAYAAPGGEILVWIPTDGGICRHKTPECCAMLNPRMISARNAQALNMEACEICMPE